MNEEASKAAIVSYVSQHIPALTSLGAEVVTATTEEVMITAPLSKNHNDKASAFAGSQYLLAIAASWALAYLNALAAGAKEPDLIGAEGSIKYLKPARSETIVAHAKADEEQMQRFRKAIARNRPALLNQQAVIEDEGVASEFRVKFILPVASA